MLIQPLIWDEIIEATGVTQLTIPFYNIEQSYFLQKNILIKLLLSLSLLKFLKKCLAYISQGSHTGQLDLCNWLAHEGKSIVITIIIINIIIKSKWGR